MKSGLTNQISQSFAIRQFILANASLHTFILAEANDYMHT
jgi:hypothetical protein